MIIGGRKTSVRVHMSKRIKMLASTLCTCKNVEISTAFSVTNHHSLTSIIVSSKYVLVTGPTKSAVTQFILDESTSDKDRQLHTALCLTTILQFRI